jgi:acetoin utilization deacetylase AcuC-like enzyme
MKLFYSDTFSFPLPPGHRFPLGKYSVLRKRLLAEKTVNPDTLILSKPATDEQLLRVHTSQYLKRVMRGDLTPNQIRRIGLPWSPELVARSRRSVGGTIAASQAALEQGISINLAGGTHHAHADWGSGFCVFNDVAVAARSLQVENSAGRMLVIDCDVHQGDGTAAIFTNDPSVFTFSIHAQRNFPFRKSASDLDIGLEDGVGDEQYLALLKDVLDSLFKRYGPFDLAFYLAGADPFCRDSFGHLALTKQGLQQRDRMVFAACLYNDLPVSVVLAGGYAPVIDDIVDIHQNTVKEALIFERSWNRQ